MQRLLLLIPATSYRAADFLAAARRLEVEVVVGSNHRGVLARFTPGHSLYLDFAPEITADVARITEYARRYPISAIVGCDEATGVLAASAADVLKLCHNAPEAVAAAHDKYQFRQVLRAAGLPAPWFEKFALDRDPARVARAVPFPCVLKPLDLSASQGVIRADDRAGFVIAWRRLTRLLRSSGWAENTILVEGFIPGREFALEGLLADGRLHVLALFDKPDPLDGPYFEETIYVTPSGLPAADQDRLAREVAGAAEALGLRQGPLHAELRLNDQGIWLIELAARSIGGRCAGALRFAPGIRLEELILRHALGLAMPALKREGRAAGVMMIPIPAAGSLREVRGRAAAARVPGIDQVIIEQPIGAALKPLPEGDRYLGFIFARAETAAEVDTALRQAHRCLRFDIEIHVGATGF